MIITCNYCTLIFWGLFFLFGMYNILKIFNMILLFNMSFLINSYIFLITNIRVFKIPFCLLSVLCLVFFYQSICTLLVSCIWHQWIILGLSLCINNWIPQSFSFRSSLPANSSIWSYHWNKQPHDVTIPVYYRLDYILNKPCISNLFLLQSNLFCAFYCYVMEYWWRDKVLVIRAAIYIMILID